MTIPQALSQLRVHACQSVVAAANDACRAPRHTGSVSQPWPSSQSTPTSQPASSTYSATSMLSTRSVPLSDPISAHSRSASTALSVADSAAASVMSTLGG
jgi:hypothetical protein